MGDYTIALLIGLMAGIIFFIDGWGPSKENESFSKSRRFRGLAILIAGGIITPVLDYLTQNEKHEFVLSYLKGCVFGWFSVFLLGLIIYLFWKVTSDNKEDSLWYKAGEFAYSILDFIYLGISDNPHLKAKRDSDVEVSKGKYKLKGEFKLKQLDEELKARNTKPNEIDETTKKKIQEYEDKLKNIKMESDYTSEDWFYKGLAEYNKNEYEKTIAYMKNALEKDIADSNSPEAYLYMGISYGRLGLPDKALEMNDIIIKQYPKYKDINIAHNNRGVALDKLTRKEEALKAYNDSIRLEENYELAWLNKGRILNDLNKADEALLAVDEAIRLKPDFADSWAVKGFILLNLDRKEDALVALDESLRLMPDNEFAWGNKGFALELSERYIEALAAYDNAIKYKNEKEAISWFRKAVVLTKMNRIIDALDSYSKAIKLNPDNSEAFFNKACLFALRKEKDNMLADLKKAIDLNSEYKNEAKEDNDFEAFWNDEDFKKLVE